VAEIDQVRVTLEADILLGL
jgi:hypothetical protein